MAEIDFPEPDCIEGAPHPRQTPRLFGQEAAERSFLQAFNSGRLHHAWLISGPGGIGKATLAWKIARFLLATPEDDGGMFAPEPPLHLDIDPDHAVARRIEALSEPRLSLLRRTPNDTGSALSQVITVEDVRKMKGFFALSAADGGRRVAIIDSVDEMNSSSANALLKLLEEPPPGVVFLLISHQPAKLLPTIRSRCRDLRLVPLGPEDLGRALEQAGGMVEPDEAEALAELAQGSVGEAFRLAQSDGLTSYAAIIRLFERMPGIDRLRALDLAETTLGKGREARFDLLVAQIEQFLSRLSRAAVARQSPLEAAPGEAALMARLAPHSGTGRDWAELALALSARARKGRAVNLDPAALLMDILLRVDASAQRILSGLPGS